MTGTVPRPDDNDPRDALSPDERFLLATLRGGSSSVSEQLERLADMAVRGVISPREHLHVRRAIEWGE